MADLEIQQLRTGMAELGFAISPDQSVALVHYLEQLEKINSHLNLTSKTLARLDWVTLHLLDSLTALKALPVSQPLRIMDVGTGGGFPGVPLACLLPHCEVTLVDTISKKVKFATEAAQFCGIRNVIGVHGRAEMLARKKIHAAKYDVLISRAVTAFAQLMQWLLPLTKDGGVCIAMKGAGYKSETQGSEGKLAEFGGKIESIIDIVLPQTGILRHLIIVRKNLGLEEPPLTDADMATAKRKREEKKAFEKAKAEKKTEKAQEKSKGKVERMVQQREKEKAKQRDKALRKKTTNSRKGRRQS
jgi:16S rRNA (guanine527-N7)-methyltransferase